MLLVLALVFPSTTGCDKVPTFKEMIGQDKKQPPPSRTQVKTRPPKTETSPVSSPPTTPSAPPKPTPEEVLARFNELRPNDIQNQNLAQLAELETGLETVTSLDLKHSQVTDAGLSHLERFPNLTELVIDGVKFTPNGLQSVAQVETLEKLSLRGAPHPEVGMHSFDAGLVHLAEMHHLKELDLTGVRLTDAGLAPIASLVNLEKLVLDKTAVTNAGLVHLKGLTNLKDLSLSETRISDEGYVNFKGLLALEALRVSWTRTNGIGFRELRRRTGTGLKFIDAGGTQFGAYGFVSIKGWKSLEALHVSEAGVTDSSLVGISACGNLQQLSLAKNDGITDFGMQQLKALRKLQVLDLQNLRRVTDRGLQFFVNCKELETLQLDGTGCTLGGATTLKGILQKKKYAPNLTIHVQGRTL